MRSQMRLEHALDTMMSNIAAGVDFADACFDGAVSLKSSGWDLIDAYEALEAAYDACNDYGVCDACGETHCLQPCGGSKLCAECVSSALEHGRRHVPEAFEGSL